MSSDTTAVYSHAEYRIVSSTGTYDTAMTTNLITNSANVMAAFKIQGVGIADIDINIGDTWKAIESMSINIGDAWKTVTEVKINIGDAWKTVYSA